MELANLKPWCPPPWPVQLPVRSPTATSTTAAHACNTHSAPSPDLKRLKPENNTSAVHTWFQKERSPGFGPLSSQLWRWTWLWSIGRMKLSGETKHYENIQPQWRFVHYTSHMDWAGIDPRSPPSLNSVCLKSGSAFVSISEFSSCLTENSPLLGFEVQPLKLFWVGNNRCLLTVS